MIPQIDEAQRRHYNDSYTPYQPTTTPNPYDQVEVHPNPYDRPPPAQQVPYGAGTPLSDPFNPPPHNMYSSPPPPQMMYPPQQDTAYGAYRPGSTPLHTLSPPPPPPMLSHSPGPNPLLAPPGPSTTPGSLYRRSGYELHDGGDDLDIDTGDIPLLRRDPSSVSSIPHLPGGYDDGDMAAGGDDARSENNIRYGRIPQRVPRRYKTTKKVE